MTHDRTERAKLLARVRRLQGQAAGLERMLSSDAECLDILQQIAAMRGAVNGLMAEVLEHHIVDHLGTDTGAGERREADVQLVLKAVRSYLK